MSSRNYVSVTVYTHDEQNAAPVELIPGTIQSKTLEFTNFANAVAVADDAIALLIKAEQRGAHLLFGREKPGPRTEPPPPPQKRKR